MTTPATPPPAPAHSPVQPAHPVAVASAGAASFSSARSRTIGVLGGGQLGRMLALAGVPLGLRFRFLDPDPDCPAADVGDLIVGEYTDPLALSHLARDARVITYEFENVPARACEWLSAQAPVFPPQTALAVSQDRLSEKTLFRELGVATPEFARVDTIDDLREALGTIGTPAVLKTRRFGYDGKGQRVIRSQDDALAAWADVAREAPLAELILEAFVPFAREVSVIIVRAAGGQVAVYPPLQNTHQRGILARSHAPAPNLTKNLRDRYIAAARRIADKLDYVGVLAVEFFELVDGTILANEMAPRVHNSGHWTIEGAACSQFENHVRAVAGLPLGSTDPRGSSIMLNIIGAEPDMPALLALPGAHVHMYGKAPRAGRKLGHVTLCDTDADRLDDRARKAAACLRNT